MEKAELYKELYHKFNSDSFYNFEHHISQQFQGIDMENKRILEIGCGKGFLSLYIACFMKPAEVVALDEGEGAGSDKNVLNIFSENLSLLEPGNIRIVKQDIFEFTNESFDIIIANNALHHVCEPGLLTTDSVAREKYKNLFKHIYHLIKPDGILTIFEYSRNSIWRYLPSKRFKEIEWHLHPTLSEWQNVIRSAGFRVVVSKHSVPYKLRKVPFIINSISLYFYLPTFYLIAKTSV